MSDYVPPNGGLKPGDEALAAHVAAGRTIREAAALADLNEKTVRRRMANAAFAELVTRLRREALDRAGGLLTESAGKAAARVTALIDSPDDRLALAASKELLGAALKW